MPDETRTPGQPEPESPLGSWPRTHPALEVAVVSSRETVPSPIRLALTLA
jgi:hypothetical protein